MWLPSLMVGASSVLAALLGLPAAAADPTPAPAPPPLPNVNAYAPISPVPYSVMDGNAYVFAGPPGVTCMISRQTGGYGCSGPLPGAPEGANLVSGGAVGSPGFSTADRPIYGDPSSAKPLPPNTRLSFREISCGIDGGGTLACVNSRDQVGFVISPTGTYVNDASPFLERPEGTNPYLPFPGMPPG